MSDPLLTLADVSAEQSVLGAVLLSDTAMDALVTEIKLRPEHFSQIEHIRVFAAMIGLYDEQAPIDIVTLRDRLRGQPVTEAQLDLLAASVPAVGHVRQYALTVVELAHWRNRMRALYDAQDAISRRDPDDWSAAMHRLDAAEARRDTGLRAPDELGLQFLTWYEDPENVVIPTPWPMINDGLFGGLRPGDTTIMAGWSGMGKSVGGDFMLEVAAAAGYSGCAYVNEMGEIERTARLLAARSGLKFERILRKMLATDELRKLVDHASKLPFWLQPCAGWNVEELARDIRRRRWPIAFVDRADRIRHGGKTHDLDLISETLADAARQSGTHLVMSVQLNRGRVSQRVSAARPRPALQDLRGTGAWEHDARNVIFVHRNEEETDTGKVMVDFDGVMDLAKVSNGRKTEQPVTLNPVRMRLDAVDPY
jgi:replicative DNA helicase